MAADRRAFYEYHSTLMEPWDGPASIAFTDGTVVGAVLDRNGLRPSRYYVTKDDLVVMASEVGVLDVPPENVLVKERLHPGRIFLVDTAQGRIIDDEEIKSGLAAEHPYQAWLDAEVVHLDDLPPAPGAPVADRESLRRRQRAFGLHGGGPAHTARPHGRAGRRARRVDGHRHRARGAVGPAAAALRLLQAALRAGHQPAPRRHPGGARHRHELDPGGRAEPAEAGARVLPPDPHRVPHPRQRRDGPDPAQPRPGPAGDDPVHRVRPARGPRRHREGDGRAVPPGQRRHRRGPCAARALRPRRRRRPRADSRPPRHRRRPPPPRARGHPHPMRPHRRVGRAPRAAPHVAAPRLRRGGGQPVPRVRDHRGDDRAGRRGRRRGRAEGHPPSHPRPHQGGAEGDVEDGHLDPPELPGGPDLRGGGPRQAVRRPLLHVDGVPARGHRHRHRRGGGQAAARGGVPDPRRRGRRARQRRRVPVAARRRVPPVQPRHRLQAAARHPQRAVRHLPRLRAARQRPEPQAGDVARPLQAAAGRRAGAPRRRRAGRVDLQAVLDRRDVVRLDQRRGPTRPWPSP